MEFLVDLVTTSPLHLILGLFNLLMDSSKTVAIFTISGDSINLGANTLTITSTATFSGGTINNSSGGLVKVTSTATTTFSGTIISVPVDVTSNNILLNGSKFNNTLSIVKKGINDLRKRRKYLQ